MYSPDVDWSQPDEQDEPAYFVLPDAQRRAADILARAEAAGLLPAAVR